jgi:hypothetical protein
LSKKESIFEIVQITILVITRSYNLAQFIN